jgi:hypothetical protein
MAHFAKIDDQGIVVSVIVVNNETLNNLEFPESEPVGIAFLTEWSGGYTNWKQTSYNFNFRKHFAGVGCTYDSVLDAFIPPKAYPSWVLNADTCEWEAPTPYPLDENVYDWDEETLSWVQVNV